jgi:lipoprotein NlpI
MSLPGGFTGSFSSISDTDSLPVQHAVSIDTVRRGSITKPETFSVASLANMDQKIGPERACEVAFYLGTFYLERHDRNEAKRRFEAAVNACPPSLIELGAAKAELTRLQSTR